MQKILVDNPLATYPRLAMAATPMQEAHR
jgi:hypothetical protein